MNEPNMQSSEPSPFESTPIDMLRQFLRGELAAAATYDAAVAQVEGPNTRMVLERCRQSHAERAVVLGQELRRRGEEPPSTAGVWGAFAKTVERGAALFGDSAIVHALYAGEVNGLDSYEAGVAVFEPAARALLAKWLIVPQQSTVDRMGLLVDAVR